MGVSPCEEYEHKKALPGKASQNSKPSNAFAVSSSHIQGQEQHRQLLQTEEMFETCIMGKCPDALCCHCQPYSVGQRSASGHVILDDDQH